MPQHQQGEPPFHTVFILQLQTWTHVAVFRTDWTADDSWLLLDSEDEPCRSTHDQPSQTAVALYARGVYLLIDPGDGRNYDTEGATSWQHRWLTMSPADTHQYEELLHFGGREGTGQIDGSLALGTNEATWSTWNVTDEPVELRAVFLNPAVTIRSETGPTNWASSQLMDHTYLRVSAQGGRGIRLRP